MGGAGRPRAVELDVAIIVLVLYIHLRIHPATGGSAPGLRVSGSGY